VDPYNTGFFHSFITAKIDLQFGYKKLVHNQSEFKQTNRIEHVIYNNEQVTNRLYTYVLNIQ